MKMLLASAMLFFVPLGAHAACATTDFAIKDFKPSLTSVGSTTRITLRGELVNNCATPSAAQIRIEIKDEDGKVLQTKQAWPAGTSNITPGEATKFDLGRLFRFQSSMTSFTASVVEVRAW